MKSLASLTALLLAGASPAAAQEPPPGDGPRGSSGEVRYDAVGYAGQGELSGVSATSAALPPGSYAEVTALDTGRTIVVAIVGGVVAPDRVAMLSIGATTALGLSGSTPAVRIRKVTPTPQDIVALRDGQAASFRAEAPAALLVALRKKLPSTPLSIARGQRPEATTNALAKKPVPRAVPVAPAPRSATPPVEKPKPTPATSATSGYVVQVAALSNAARAATVAKAVGGTVIAGPPVWRVRIGPYPDTATAARAKADAARKGYPGGQITRIP